MVAHGRRGRSRSLRDSIGSISDLIFPRTTTRKSTVAEDKAGVMFTVSAEADATPTTTTTTTTTTITKSFTVHRTRIWTKEGWNSYQYADIRLRPIPTIRITAPDDRPFTMDITTAELADERPRPAIMRAKRFSPPPRPQRPRLRNLSMDANVEKPLPPIPESYSCSRSSSTRRQRRPPSPPLTPVSPTETYESSESDLSSPTEYLSSAAASYPASLVITNSPPPTPYIMGADSPTMGFSPTSSSFEETPKTGLTDIPSELLYEIFTHLDQPRDMVSLALCNSNFYRLFVGNTLSLLKASLQLSSPTAYELASLSKPTISSARAYYALQRKQRRTVETYKTLIRARCRYFLSPHLFDPIFASEEESFSDALRLIWIFSSLFGRRPGAVDAQVAWLHAQALSLEELRNISEVYHCLNMLLRPLTTSPPEPDTAKWGLGVLASQAGSGSGSGSEDGSVESGDLDPPLGVEKWVWFLQTRTLELLEPVVSAEDDDDMWRSVQASGLDNWGEASNGAVEGAGAGADWECFLREAVRRVLVEHSQNKRDSAVFEDGSASSWGAAWE